VLLQMIGTPVLQDGTRLALSNVTLVVLRECSGVNQLFAVVAMALPAGYLWLESKARRATLVCLAVLLAYLSNGIRIAMVGVLATHGLSDGNLRGVHLFEGLAVSALCYVLILASLSVLRKTERKKLETSTNSAVDVAPVLPWVDRRIWPEAGVFAVAIWIGVVLQV